MPWGSSMTRKANKPRVQIWTDGSTWPENPGNGGWSVVLINGTRIRALAGYEKRATNNNMETRGVLEGLRALKEPCIVDLYTDSMYVFKGMRALAFGRALGTNVDLWEAIQPLVAVHQVFVHHIKGHAGELYNEYADSLASEAATAGAELGGYCYDQYVQAVPQAIQRRAEKRKASRAKRLAKLQG